MTYSDGSRDVPMFTMKAQKSSVAPAGRPAPTAAWAQCPMHSQHEKRTALVYVGIHLAWKVHYHKVGNASVPCRASGVALCVAPPKDGKMRIRLTAKQAASDDGIRDAKCRHR